MKNCSNCKKWEDDKFYNLGICHAGEKISLTTYINRASSKWNWLNTPKNAIMLSEGAIKYTTAKHYCSLHEERKKTGV